MSTPEDPQNPYAPPSAELGDEVGIRPLRIGWRVYFWLILVLFPISFAVIFFVGRVQPLDILDFAVSAVGLLGLFGYAHARALLSRRFWTIWLPVEVLWDLLVIFVLVPQGVIYLLPESEPSGRVEDFLSLALVLPLYVSLYLYGFRSDELWEEHSEAQPSEAE